MNMNLPPSVVSLMHSMNTYGRYDIAPTHHVGSLSYEPESQSRSERTVDSNEKPHQQITSEHVTGPTPNDVINGRGQGVQRHPGNEKYRELVSRNKGLYATCPRSDKAKISRAIVAAVRQFGGGFLELDERSGEYFDIGEKKAVAKTSQALREGQTKIRKKMHKESDKHDYDTSLLARGETGPLPFEDYLGHCLRVLDSLYHREKTAPGLPLPTIDRVVSKPPACAAKEPNVAAKANARSKPMALADKEIIEYSLRVLESQPLYETEQFLLPPLPTLEMDLQCPSIVSEVSNDDKSEAGQSQASNLELLASICAV
jgi:hypothetical protein